MDDRTFDTLARRMAQHHGRRALLKGLLGLAGAASIGALAATPGEAARRGYAGPFPRPTEVTGPPPCTDANCYGCHGCVGGVCTDQPKTNCYDHTGECLAAYCTPDGGCGYGFDCRVNLGCCGNEQVCNQTTGQCECKPDTCCGVDCPGCQTCQNGQCTSDPGSCYDHTAECRASVCEADGGCSYPFDCRVKAGCCTGNTTCNTATGACVS